MATVSEGEKRKSSNDSGRVSDNGNNNNIGDGIKNKSAETATAVSSSAAARLSRKVRNLQQPFAILGFLAAAKGAHFGWIHSVNRMCGEAEECLSWISSVD